MRLPWGYCFISAVLLPPPDNLQPYSPVGLLYTAD